MIKSPVSLAVVLALAGAISAPASDWETAVSDPAAAQLPRPSRVQYDWHEQERLNFICLDPATWQGDSGYDKHTVKPSNMKMEKFDVNQWMNGIQSWGAKEVMLVCKHTGGFCWWPTETTDYDVEQIAWKNGEGNLVKEIADACRKRGLTVGVYIYSDDPEYSGGKIGRGGRTADPAKQEEWNAKLRQQWREVLGIYGKDLVREIWFDGSCIVPLFDILEEMAPNAVVLNSPRATIRWSGNEDGTVYGANWSTVTRADLESGVATHAQSDPDGDAWAPIECDTTVYRRGWFWSAQAERQRKPAAEMLTTFVHSVGNGAVLLYNMSPKPDGSIAAGDMKVYEEFGQLIEKNFGHPLAQIEQKAGAEIVVPLGGMKTINCVDAWEDYRHGQRVRAYQVDAWIDGKWQTVATGTSIGRRKIDIFDAVATDKIKVRVLKQVGTPLFRKILVHQVTPELEKAIAQRPSLVSSAVVTASSNLDASPNIDGKAKTHWTPAAADKERWLAFDFGTPTRIAGMAATDFIKWITRYVIEVRNETNEPWRAIYTGSTIGHQVEVTLPPTTTREVRFRIVRSNPVNGRRRPAIDEMDFFDRPEAWSEIPVTLPDGGSAIDIDLSGEVVKPTVYDLRIEGAMVQSIEPLFEGAVGEAHYLEKIEDQTYRLTRAHDTVGEGNSTGIRLTATPQGEGPAKVRIRPSP